VMKSIHLALIALVFSFLSLTLSAQEEPEQGSKTYATIDEAFIARMSGLFAAEDPKPCIALTSTIARLNSF
ncbi:MAG TPA: hypothetical protein PKH81_08650, partial [Treponemataceae bacterium]|nr:hypothetical protein [Treponemataceae bacterium]